MRAPLLAILPLLAISGCSGTAVQGSSGIDAHAAHTAGNTVAATAQAHNHTGGAVSSTGGAKATTRSDGLLEYELSYPAAVGAIPALAALIERRGEDVATEMREDARLEQAETTGTDSTSRSHYLSFEWKVVADLPRFLSLSSDIATYTGGAHGMYDRVSAIWDREGALMIDPATMFSSPEALDRALGERHCQALARQRRERRGPDWTPGGAFDDCPPLDQLTLLLGSGNGHTFDRLSLYAGPYMAGPYAEGAYEVELSIDVALLGAVRPEYRAYFSAGG